jgi:hypothetical protein
MRLEISSPADLVQATDAIHDLWFSLDEVLEQEGADRTLRLSKTVREAQLGPIQVSMCIRHVYDLNVRDTERVGFYDVNELIFEPGLLTVTTGVPLVLQLKVHELALTLETVERLPH